MRPELKALHDLITDLASYNDLAILNQGLNDLRQRILRKQLSIVKAFREEIEK